MRHGVSGSAPSPHVDVLVLFEHPEWQRPLFEALERRGLSYAAFDLKTAAFDPAALPSATVVFNQASPSAYVRGHDRAVPLAMTLLRAYEASGARVLNGAAAFGLELSKAAQLTLMDRIDVRGPRSLVFNDVDALARQLEGSDFPFPALVKPDQGGSGARMREVTDVEDIRRVLEAEPELWSPDPILLLQEKLDYDPDFGIVRLEVLGGELLYAMRVVSHGAFNLCPSEVCNPTDGEGGACAIPAPSAPPKVEFYAYPEVPERAVQDALRIAKAGGLDVAGLEYAEVDGEPVFYDVNANSNLRPAIAETYGFDPFERVVDFLEREVHEARALRPAS